MRFSENKLSVSVFGFKVRSRFCSNTPVQNIISRKAFYSLDNTERYFTKTSPVSKAFTYALRPLKQKLLVANIVCTVDHSLGFLSATLLFMHRDS